MPRVCVSVAHNTHTHTHTPHIRLEVRTSDGGEGGDERVGRLGGLHFVQLHALALRLLARSQRGQAVVLRTRRSRVDADVSQETENISLTKKKQRVAPEGAPATRDRQWVRAWLSNARWPLHTREARGQR